MKTNARNRLWILSAVAAVGIFTYVPQGQAQYMTENNTGRALDVNNRLGSGGNNDAKTMPGATADDVVYGNVTRGREFHGKASSDPTAFRGNVDRNSENLDRDSGGSVYDQSHYSPFVSQRYYSDSRWVSAPTGFTQTLPGSSGAFQSAPQNFRLPGDLRLDASIPSVDYSLPRPGELQQPGMVFTFGPQLVMLDPITDMRLLSQAKEQALSDTQMPSRELMRRLNLDEQRIRQMR